MSIPQSPAFKPGSMPSSIPHIHVGAETCPTCDQPIPHDRFEEIKERIDARQSARETQITSRLMEEFGRQKAEAVEQARREAADAAATQLANAREEARRVAEAAANQRISEAEQVSKNTVAAMQTRIAQAEAAKSDAEARIDQVRRDSAESIQKMKQDAEAKETTIREEAQKQAEAGVQERLAGMERSRQETEATLRARVKDAEDAKVTAQQSNTALQDQLNQVRADGAAAIEKAQQDADARVSAAHQESEAAFQARIQEAEDAKVAAQQSNTALQDQLNQVRADGAAAIEKAQQDADARVNAARQEATAVAESALREQVTGAEHAKSAAEAKAAATEEAARVLKETHESAIEARVSEVRLAMEADKLQAVNAAEAARSEDNRKLSERLADMQRRLDKQTADQLGEGAEVNLYEDIKARFELQGDKVERVGKGKPGADVIHTVKHNGMVCGKIIYDSKNHLKWRYDFSEKLAADKIAEKADHAILSTRAFPEGMKQLDVMDGVILANPARVVALVQVVREHIVKSHTLRMSKEEKTLKSAELYAFITSPQYTDLLDRIDTQAQELLDMRVKEQKAHEKMWKDQDILYRSIQKTGAELNNRVDIILGTAGKADKAINQ